MYEDFKERGIRRTIISFDPFLKRPGFGEQVSVWYVIQSRSVSVPAVRCSECG